MGIRIKIKLYSNITIVQLGNMPFCTHCEKAVIVKARGWITPWYIILTRAKYCIVIDNLHGEGLKVLVMDMELFVGLELFD